MEDKEMRAMLIEYMSKGFLDNIIAMFRQDRSLCRFVADMLGDEQMQVRLGATALVEELVGEHRDGLDAAVPGLIALLKHENPTIRGDALSVLGIITYRTYRVIRSTFLSCRKISAVVPLWPLWLALSA